MSTEQPQEPVNFFGPEIIADPYSTYARMRNEHPVYYSATLHSWIVSRFSDVERVLEDPNITVYTVVPPAVPDLPDDLATKMKEIHDFWRNWGPSMRPPEHTASRDAQEPGFAGSVVADFEGIVQGIADGLIDALDGQTEADLVQAYTFMLPVQTIAAMFGMSGEELPRLIGWSMAITTFLGTPMLTADSADAINGMYQTMGDMREYLGAKITANRANPDNSVLSHIVQSADRSGALSDDDVITLMAVYTFGTHGTTMNFLGNSLVALFQNTDQLELLRSQPEIAEQASVELLRFAGPVQVGMRYAPEEMTLGGQTIKQGENMVLFYASANHDPAQFENPEVLDLTRAASKNFAAGGGIHNCIGWPFIMQMGRIGFNTLLRRLPGLRMASDEPNWMPLFAFRGLTALPVQFDNVLPR